MKTYEIIEFEDGRHSVKMTVQDGTTYDIQPIDSNPFYQEYLRFTAWVEADNDPDEFWTQTEGLI
jgi:hypothetical protein